MEHIFSKISRLYIAYRDFWEKENKNFTICVETLKASARNIRSLNRASLPDDPNHDVQLTVIQATEQIFADKIAPLVKTIGEMALRTTGLLQDIDRYLYKNNSNDAVVVFGRQFSDVYPPLENIYRSIIIESNKVLDAVDNLNYTDEESFKPLNDAIVFAFKSIELLKDYMIYLNFAIDLRDEEI